VASGKGLDRIESCFGRIVAHDGRYCVWFTRDSDKTRDSFDVRDIAAKVGMSLQDVIEALPEFAPAKRGRASVTPEDSND